MTSTQRSVAVAMSGGVDSSVAAWILQQKGYDCHGIMMQLFGKDELALLSEGVSAEADTADAERIAELLGIPFTLADVSKEFHTNVMNYFAESYLRGETPNPCVQCNRTMKFGVLMEKAKCLGCTALATGHYANIEQDPASGRYLLSLAADPSKDQTYVLWSLTQEQLAHTLFPLGKLQKSQIRALAEQNGFCNAQRKDSQDICFIPDGAYADFLERYLGGPYPCGQFLDRNGKVLGTHRGMIHYTVGQRKGLGIAFGQPTYVCGKCASRNTVTLGKNEDLFSKELYAHSVNLIAVDAIKTPMRVLAKIRYQAKPAYATVEQTDEHTVHVRFDEAQRAVSPGQSVVFYDGAYVVGGGIIADR